MYSKVIYIYWFEVPFIGAINFLSSLAFIFYSVHPSIYLNSIKSLLLLRFSLLFLCVSIMYNQMTIKKNYAKTMLCCLILIDLITWPRVLNLVLSLINMYSVFEKRFKWSFAFCCNLHLNDLDLCACM